jgi:hypothetical protein
MTFIAAIAMLVSGPVVVLFTSGLTDQADVVTQSVNAKQMLLLAMTHNLNAGFIGFEIAFPIITAIALFKYLHTPGGVAVVHALPLSRDTLFRSNVLSGLVLIFAPVILTMLTLLPFMKFGFKGLSLLFSGGEDSPELLEVFSDDGRMPDIGDLIGLFIIITVIVLFVFAVSILAVVITGNSGVGFISAGLLNFIVPVFFMLTIVNLRHFLYGYTVSPATSDLESALHPLTYTFVHSGGLSPLTLVIFVLISAAVFVCAMLLYRAFRSERAGDTIVFRSFEYALTWLVTFLGMIAGGFLFESVTFESSDIMSRFDPVPVNFYIGAVIGAVLTFAVVSMVVRKSPKALGVRALKSFGCFAVIGVIFFVFVSTDVTGYETRVPENSAVKKVSIDATDLMNLPYIGNLASEDADGNFVSKGLITSDDPGMIAAVTDFHREIIDKASDSKNKELFISDPLEGAEINETPDYPNTVNFVAYIPISYDLGDKHKVSRTYTLTTKYLDNSEAFSALFDTKAYKESLTIARIMPYKTIASARLSYPNYGPTLTDGSDPYDKIMSSAEAVELAKCLDEDFVKLSYRDLSPDNEILLTFSLNPYNSNKLKSSYGQELQYSITGKYEKTIAWLKAHGYYDEMIAATALYKADFKKMMEA